MTKEVSNPKDQEATKTDSNGTSALQETSQKTEPEDIAPEATEEEAEELTDDATPELNDETPVEPTEDIQTQATDETPLESNENITPQLVDNDNTTSTENAAPISNQETIAATSNAATTSSAAQATTANININNMVAEPSSRRRRFFAHFFDSIILGIAINIFIHFLPAQTVFLRTIEEMTLLPFVLTFLYFSVFPASPLWGTPGQRMLGIYICRAKDGLQISLLVSMARVILFYLLWIVSFGVTVLVVVGPDIKKLEDVLTKGVQHKKSIQLNGTMFYKNKPMLVSFQDNKSKKTVHLLSVLGATNVIIEDAKHQLSLSHNGTPVATQYYDHRVSLNKHIKNTSNGSLTQDLDEGMSMVGQVLDMFIKVIAYSISLFILLLVVPTLLNPRKQTIYDMICGVMVARDKK